MDLQLSEADAAEIQEKHETSSLSLLSNSTQQTDGLCDQTGTVTFIVIGNNSRTSEQQSGADSIRMVEIDFDSGSAVVFSFPRDLLLSSPGLEEDYGLSEANLGYAYYYVEHNTLTTSGLQMTESQRENSPSATSAIAQMIYDNFGIVPEHYFTFRYDLFVDALRRVGTIEVNIPEAVQDSSLNLDLQPGPQTISATTAQNYMRYVEDGNPLIDEWNRFDRQNVVIEGLQHELMDSSVLAMIPGLISDFEDNVITDFSIDDLSNLACVASQIDMNNVQFLEITRNMVRVQGNSMVLINPTNLREQLLDLFQ
jgi:anionic cell wall polymer biosynthesis LytR-Cps2A-Psr (LCP) family protein